MIALAVTALAVAGCADATAEADAVDDARDKVRQVSNAMYGTPARSQNSWTSRDLPTWRRPRRATAVPAPVAATRSSRFPKSASSAVLPMNTRPPSL